MVEIRVCTDATCSRWDHFVEKSGGSYLQTSLWAQVKKPLGWEAIRLIAIHQDEIVSGMQILLRKVPLFGHIAYVPHGPVVLKSDPSTIEFLYKGMEEIVQKYRIQYLNLQPALETDDFVTRLLAAKFRPSHVNVAISATCLLDLTQDLDTIWGNFKKNRRKGIRRALCSDLTVREGGWEDLEGFFNLLTALIQRRKGKSYPISYYRHKWRVLHPGGYSRLFVLEHRGEPLSMHWVIPFGKTLVSKLAVWSGRYPELHPNELIEWWVIQWAKAQEYQYYDFEGVDLRAAQALLADQPLPTQLEQSATSFKLSFGGTPTVFPPAIERFSNHILRYLYTSFLHSWIDSSFLKQVVNRVRTYDGNNAVHQ